MLFNFELLVALELQEEMFKGFVVVKRSEKDSVAIGLDRATSALEGAIVADDVVEFAELPGL